MAGARAQRFALLWSVLGISNVKATPLPIFFAAAYARRQLLYAPCELLEKAAIKQARARPLAILLLVAKEHARMASTVQAENQA